MVFSVCQLKKLKKRGKSFLFWLGEVLRNGNFAMRKEGEFLVFLRNLRRLVFGFGGFGLFFLELYGRGLCFPNLWNPIVLRMLASQIGLDVLFLEP